MSYRGFCSCLSRSPQVQDSRNRKGHGNTSQIAMPTADIAQQKGPNSSEQCITTHHKVSARKLNQLGNDALPHLTSHRQISSNILTAFTVASRMQKAFPRTSSNPRAGILYTAEQTNLFHCAPGQPGLHKQTLHLKRNVWA